MKLYEYAVIRQPSEAPRSTDKGEIVVQPTAILAKNEEAVKKIAARQIPDYVMDDIGQLEVVVRPF